jgi:uncharacterized protein (TIGR02246 family)
MNSDEQAIRDLVNTWMRASASGDLTKILGLMADDVVFLTPGRPPFGRKEFEAGFRSMQGKIRMEGSSEIQDVHVSRDLAYCLNRLNISMTSLATNERKERSGYTLSVLRKNASGPWEIARDANLLT